VSELGKTEKLFDRKIVYYEETLVCMHYFKKYRQVEVYL